MKTLATSVLLALTLTTAAIAAPGRTTPRAHRSATSAHYQMGAYSSIDAKYVYVAIDKEAGGRIDIRLKDKTGTVFFEQTLARKEAKVRLKLNVSDLKDGNYVLEVSNGIETTVRDINIATNEPTQTVRNIVLL